MLQYSHLCYLLALCLVPDKINPFLLCILKVAGMEKHQTLVSVLENVLKCCYFSVTCFIRRDRRYFDVRGRIFLDITN